MGPGKPNRHHRHGSSLSRSRTLGTYRWYCCTCGDGPLGPGTPSCCNSGCASFGHARCNICRVEWHNSGYGTASFAPTQSIELPTRGGSANVENKIDDGVSVATNNMSVDLAPDVVDAYVNLFAKKIYQSTLTEPSNDISASVMLQSLPDLLRDFAQQLAFGEKTSDATIISIFTRQNKLYGHRPCSIDHIA